MEKYYKILKIGLLSLCLMLVLSLTVQAKSGMPLTPKSKSKALTYSFVGILAPMVVSIPLLKDGGSAGFALGSFGLLFGPGLGHLYAENSNRFVSGMFIRGVAGVVAIYSLSKFEIDIWGNDNHDNSGPVLGFLLGGATLVASSIYDISTTGESVDRYNKQHALSQIKLQPCYWANHQAIGFSLGYRF